MTRLTIVVSALLAVDAQGQTLEQRVLSAGTSTVEFTAASRPTVCGDGRSYIRTEGGQWYGSWTDGVQPAACERGLLRVRIHKAGRDIVRVQAFVGPLATAVEGTDLGRVSASAAADWLGMIVRRAEGRAARDAIVPLTLVDSISATGTLRAVVKDGERSREVRRAALSAAVRQSTPSDATEYIQFLTSLAQDASEHATIRQDAIGQLARVAGDEGVPAAIRLTQGVDAWAAKHAAEVLARSGDPRARRALRELLARSDVAADVRAAAMTGLGGEDGTKTDADAIIQAYPSLQVDKLRDAAIAAVGSIGGSSARSFLLTLVKDETAPARQRRRAAQLLDRVGLSVREALALYDAVSDGEVKGALIDVMARSNTKEALAKLISIAKLDTQPTARRRAIGALANSDDPSVKEALKGMVGATGW